MASRWTAVPGLGFTIRGNRIVEINVLRNPTRLSKLDLALLKG
jgi:hypothetical protein